MGHPLRHIPEGGALVEVTLNTIQGRFLLRPDREGRVNEVVLGVLGRAQRLYGLLLMGISVLSSHLHLLAYPADAKQLSSFMRHVGGNLSKEIGLLHNWPGKLWARRYRGIRVSDEEEDQVARLRYLLAAGVKEHLVERAIDWPGVHSARALTRDHPLRGWWFDRSREYAARRRGERPGRYEYATEETVILDPLPCWAHLPIEEVRRRVKDLLRDIESEAAAERRRPSSERGRSSAATRRSVAPKKVLGVEKVMSADPHYRPEKLERSPAPDFHARRKSVRKAMREAYAWVVAAYREAAERLRAGDRLVSFPEGTFPPAFPFVPYARGQPP